MLKKILVPLDGSVHAEQALGYAMQLAKPAAAQLVLIRAAMSHTLPGVDARERQSGAIQEAEEYLSQTAAAMQRRGYVCETLTPFGPPAQRITEEARLQNADLIVMSTHGRTGPGRLLFGSVAEDVVRTSSIPVLVAGAGLPVSRQPFLSDQPILVVPLDGSAFAEVALQSALALADALDAGLVLVRAEGEAIPVADAQEYLDAIRLRLTSDRPHLSVATSVGAGDPAHVIAAVALQHEASMVVMSTHGRRGLARSVTGSVPAKVLKLSSVPVILVRPRADPESVSTAAEPATAASR
jgi:nucleotide-binding universal stress UspA family protein